MILFTFAVVFVVVYLYYTINDVKKLNAEVKKLSADVVKMNQYMQNIISTVSAFNKDVWDLKAGVPSNVNNLLVKTQTAPTPSTVATSAAAAPTMVDNQSTKKQSVIDEIDLDSDDDDNTSVNTEELKKIINENDHSDDEDTEQAVEAIVDKKVDVVEQADTTDDLKKKKYDDLKELCKTKGLSTKGSKDQLIARLTGQSFSN
jgi:hypothetical protein